MSQTPATHAPYRAGRFILDSTLDVPIPGYTDGSRWNGWATPVFDFGAATRIMQAVDEANRRLGIDEDDAQSVSYDVDQDVFLISDPDNPDAGPLVIRGHDIEADGERVHVYALGTRYWTWMEA